MRLLLLLCFAFLFLGCDTKRDNTLGPQPVTATEKAGADGDGTVVKGIQKGDPTADDVSGLGLGNYMDGKPIR